MDWNLRHFPASEIAQVAQEVQATGLVDYLTIWDGLSQPFPKHLWNPDVAPAAREIKDFQSLHDPLVKLGIIAAAAPELGLLFAGTNAIRPGPAEVFRSMLSLASASQGKFIGTVAAGEAYNTIPFGYKRSEGLRRLEDHFKLYKLLWECDRPFDFKGNFWEFKAAHIGLDRTHKPTIWVEGAGPKLIDIAAQYADGWMSLMPHFCREPEVYAQKVKEIKQKVESYGRDPDAFGFGFYAMCVITEDDEQMTKACDNDLIRFFSAMGGLSRGSEWRVRGFEPPVPSDDWSYSLHYLPNVATEQETKEMITRTTPEMVKAVNFCGSAKEIATHLQGFADAGMDLCCVVDMANVIVPLEDVPAQMSNTFEVFRQLKGKS